MSGAVLKVRREAEFLKCESSSGDLDSKFVTGYFKLDLDLQHILAAIAKDDTISRAVERFYGLRLIRQERWECLASFVLATNANIPRIEKMVSAICARYGQRFEFEGEDYFAFPTAEVLAGASISDLVSCGLGYRAPFLKHVSTSVAKGDVDFDAVAAMPYEESKKILLRNLFGEKVLLGVGPKVADCVLLYSFEKDEAFPIDVWIARVIAEKYPRLLSVALRSRLRAGTKMKISPGDYGRLSQSLRRHFGKYAGYAQQYLYMSARETVS